MKTKFKLSNRILSLMLAFVMVLGMMPMTAYAAADTSAYAPTREENYWNSDDAIFANGTAITIEAAPDGTRIWYLDGGTKKYVTNNGESGEDLSGWYIFAGSNNPDGMHGVDGSITMTGGAVGSIFAGQDYGKFSGTSNITVTGGTVTDYICCNARYFTTVNDDVGTVTIYDATGATIEEGGGKADNVVQKNGTTWSVSGNGVIPTGVTLTVNEDETLTVLSDATLTNNGTLVNNGGTITVYGQWLGNAPENYVAPSDFAFTTTTLSANVSTTLTAPTATPDNTTLVPWFTYEIFDAGTTEAVINGLTITPYGAGTVKVKVIMQDGYCTPIEKIYEFPVSFTPVAGISGDVPAECQVNKKYELPTVVAPSDASYQTVTWTVVDAGTTGAVISGNQFKATNSGTATIRATVANGADYGTAFTKDYTVTVKALDYIDISHGSVSIAKKDENTVTVTYAPFGGDGTKDYPADEYIAITGTSTNQYTVTIESGEVNLLLKDCHISYNNGSVAQPIYVKSGAVLNLDLAGDNSLTHTDGKTNATYKSTALHVPTGAMLTIDGDGSLTATGGYGGAGIGGGNGDSGDITINGGVITSTGGTGAAGIGGGRLADCGTITINGGVIIARSSSSFSGAGIGGGRYCQKGSVIINGGNIKATSQTGQAIGNGSNGSGVTVQNGNGASISEVTLILNGAAADTEVTAIAGMTYGIADVKTLDTNKLYFYLPSGAAATSITAGGTVYDCTKDHKTYYASHDWSNGTGVCGRCGESCEHENQTGSTCEICGLTLHIHNWTYIKDGNTITATCNSTGCTDTDGGYVTISAPSNLTYTGSKIEAVVENTLTTGAIVNVEYSGSTTGGYPVNAGEYTAKITLDGKEISVEYTIEKATPTADDFVFTAPTDLIYDGNEKEATVTVKDGIVGMGEINVKYYRYWSGDTWLDNERAPSSPGRYKVGIWLKGGDNYEAVSSAERIWLGSEFEIKYLETDAEAIISGSKGTNGWYTSDVTLKAPEGYAISKSIYDTYGDSLTFADEQNKTVTYYLKNADGKIAEKTVELKIDKTAPVAKYQIGTDGWKQFINTITFGLFCKDYKTVDIEYTDDLSGVAKKQYYIASEEITDTSSIVWSDYTDTLNLNATGKYFIYMRVVDNAGHEVILNTEGIVIYADSEAETDSVTAVYKNGFPKDVSVNLNGNTIKSVANGTTILTENTDYVLLSEETIRLNPTYLDTLNAGEYTFTVSYNPQGVETDKVNMTTTFTVTVEKADGKVSNLSISSKTYDGTAVTAPTFDKLGDGTATIEYKVKGADDSTYTTTAPKNAGDYVVRVAVAETENYKGSSATAEFTIAKASAPIVTFPTVENAITYGQKIEEAKLSFYSNAYGTFNWTAPEGVPEFSGNYALDFYPNEEALQNYDWKSLDGTNGMQWIESRNALCIAPAVTVNKANGSAVVSIDGWTYGEEPNDPVAASETNDPASVTYFYKEKDADDSTYTGAVPTQAGKYIVKAVFATTDHYTEVIATAEFEIAKKAVNVTANDASKTYGDSDPALTYTHTALVGSDALFITVARASGENANTYTITASQAEGANPNYDITFKTGTFTIRKAALTVTVEDKTATYGDAVPNYTVKYDGFKNGDDQDDLGGTLAFACDYAQFSDKGEYTIKASGYTSGNYTINYVDGKLTVNAKPITVTIQNATSIYGETLAELKATDNGIVNGDTNVYSLATTATSDAGKYAITGTALDSNYDVTFVNGEYEITKREITITVDAKNAVVNTALPTYTYKVEGLVGEDKLVTEPTLTCNANIAVIGEYDITATGADAGGNYSIKYVPAKLSVLTDNAVDAAADYTEELKDYDPATVTSEDKAELDEILDEINTILDDENITNNGKKALEEVKEKVEDLIKEITDAAEATDTENVGKVENVTPENVTPENKTDLEGAKADLEKALEDHGSNMTEDEKKAIEDEIKRINDALEVIENVEEVEELIGKLPENITKNDEDAIKVADDAYNALSDYEKSLVDADAKKALDEAKAALAELNKPADPNSPATGDNSNMFLWIALLFISGGAVITLTVVDRKRRTASKR